MRSHPFSISIIFFSGAQLLRYVRQNRFGVLVFGLMIYFLIQALTGGRGFLTEKARNALLKSKESELQALQYEHIKLTEDINLLSSDHVSPDFLEEKAKILLGYSDPRDYVLHDENKMAVRPLQSLSLSQNSSLTF